MTASTEVVDAVQHLLESEGILQSIRAQLRASVIHALATKDSERQTSKAVEFASKESGRGSILCVMDLLVKLNLRETIAVFEAEVGLKYSDVNTDSARENIIQKLNIVSSLRDLDQPLLYQLLETPGKHNVERGTAYKPQEPHNQSESKVLNVVSKPYQQDHPTVSSPSSSAAVKSTSAYNDKSYPENDYKQRDTLPHGTGFQKFQEEVPSGVSTVDIGYDSNDDSIADEKKASKYSNDSAKDHKNGQDAKKNDLQSKHSDDSDGSHDDESFGDEKSVEFPEDDIEEEALEVGADSESSASFSLEYGYVEDPKAAETDGAKIKQISKASVNEDKVNNQSSALKSTNALKSTSSDSKECTTDLLPDAGPNGAAVGIQKHAQGPVSRSKTGWSTDDKEGDDATDDFLFSEEPESDSSAPASNSSRKNSQEHADTSKGASFGVNQDRSKSVIAKDIDVPKTSLPPVARSSWGAKPIEPKGDEKDGESDDDSEDQNAESVSEEEVSLEESGSHEEPVLSRPKRNNQEEDDEQPMQRKSSSSGSSLFASRSQSGDVLPAVSTTASKSMITRAGGSNLAIEDEEDISIDFDADEEYSKDKGAYISSQSSKLSEVEKKLAAMEKDNADLVSLRLESDLRGSKGDTIDNEASFEADGDYSEGDFESGSETKDQEESVGGDDDEAEESKSVASEDIEAMELSVGGAGSDSDTSFSGLNSDSLTKKGGEKGGSSSSASARGGLSGASKSLAGGATSYRPSVPKKKSSDEHDLSQSSADLEFSVSEFETSGSKGIDGDAGYDFTAAAIPPVNAGRGPRNRSGGW